MQFGGDIQVVLLMAGAGLGFEDHDEHGVSPYAL
jgi:hypothetical protein